MNASLPYLRPASQGTFKNYGQSPVNNRQLDPAAVAQFQAKTEANLATDQNRKWMPGGEQVQFNNLQSASQNNGNALYLRGYGQVGIGDHSFNMPNAVLQQINAQANLNRGRWSSDEYFLGHPAQRPPAQKYANYDYAKQFTNRYMDRNPQFNGVGALDPHQNAHERSLEAGRQMQMLNEQGPQMERRNAKDFKWPRETFLEDGAV